ncbi:MAG: hypothetical protein U0264_19320 [Candidatus Kapaibacterium sp.]|mgnify:CR=1 FL=1
MTKQWTPTGENTHTLSIDGAPCATVERLHTTDLKAHVTIGDARYTIAQPGFWKRHIEITDHTGTLIARAEYERWFANAMTLHYQGIAYKLVIRNNPLAEWALLDANSTTLLAYTLHTGNGTPSVHITTALPTHDLLLDCLLWYLFAPIAQENCSDTAMLVMMIAAVS